MVVSLAENSPITCIMKLIDKISSEDLWNTKKVKYMKSTMLLSHLKNCFLYIHSMSNHQTPTVYIYIDYWSVLSSSSQLDIWPDLLSKERGQLELLLYETCSALRDVRYYQLCSPPVGLEGKLFGKVQHTDWTREISPILCVRVCVCMNACLVRFYVGVYECCLQSIMEDHWQC